MKSQVAIISLRFNPAFVQHATAFAKLVREVGRTPAFILHDKYGSYPEVEGTAPVFGTQDAQTVGSWTHAIFLNPSPENMKLAAALKARGAKLYYILHEPRQSIWSVVTTEGIRQGVKTMLAHHLSIPVLRLCDKVILASRFGLEAYKRHDVKYNAACAYFPLIYDDKLPDDVQASVKKRRYFGFIGSICRAHGFDHYVAFMRHAFERELNVRFLIASRHRLPDSVEKDPIIVRNRDRIEMRCGRALSNDEMDQCYAESICVWMLYRRCTQSGVLPKAMMFGAPVIATPIGSIPEYVTDGVNGRFSEARDHCRTWEALQDISAARLAYFVKCRQEFLSQFYYRSALPLFEELL